MRHTALALIILFTACQEVAEVPEHEIPTREDLALPPPFPTFEQMVGISPIIFTGIVSGIRYARHENSPYPFTFVKFSGLEFLRKDSNVPMGRNRTLEISYAGGMYDDLTILDISEFPEFEMGQRYLVFLRGGGWPLTPIAGNGLGLFKLYGSLEEDPYLLNLEGSPVSGIEEGQMVFSRKKQLDRETVKKGQSTSEQRISPALEEKYRALSQEFLDKESREKMEAEEQEKEISREAETIPKERDQEDAFIGKWDKVMKLSQMKKMIRTIARKTANEYPEFQKLFLVPVESEKRMKPISPKQ